MDIPARLQRQFPLLLQKADTGLLEHELWAAQVAISAYQVFRSVDGGDASALRGFLQVEEIKLEDWERLGHDERLSVAAIASFHTQMLVGRKMGGAISLGALWVKRIISFHDDTLLWLHHIKQIRQMFQDTIEIFVPPEQKMGVIALLLQLEERYQEFINGERFNEAMHNEGLRLLIDWFAPFSEFHIADSTYPAAIIMQISALRRSMNRIHAYLIEGKSKTQEMLDVFSGHDEITHKRAAQILVLLIEENRIVYPALRTKEEAYAYDHLAKHRFYDVQGHADGLPVACAKIKAWLYNADTVPYFRFPDRSEQSRVLLDEIITDIGMMEDCVA